MTREEKIKAIDALKISAPIMAVTEEEFNDYIQTLNKIMDWLEQEPKKGHWEHGKELCREYLGKTLIDVTYENWHCSNCQYVIEQVSKPKWNYCPNCGADMRGEKDDNT